MRSAGQVACGPHEGARTPCPPLEKVTVVPAPITSGPGNCRAFGGFWNVLFKASFNRSSLYQFYTTYMYTYTKHTHRSITRNARIQWYHRNMVMLIELTTATRIVLVRFTANSYLDRLIGHAWNILVQLECSSNVILNIYLTPLIFKPFSKSYNILCDEIDAYNSARNYSLYSVTLIWYGVIKTEGVCICVKNPNWPLKSKFWKQQ